MRKVTFSPGPFLDQYEDGHPPEKECEEERRRYRCGLPSKVDLENSALDAAQLEQAFQEWLNRYRAQHGEDCEMPPGIQMEKEGVFLVGPLRMGDEFAEGESTPVADYTYKTFKTADGRRQESKECFVVDIASLPVFTNLEAPAAVPSTTAVPRRSMFGFWRQTKTRSVPNETIGTSQTAPDPACPLPLYLKNITIGAVLIGVVLLLTSL